MNATEARAVVEAAVEAAAADTLAGLGYRRPDAAERERLRRRVWEWLVWADLVDGPATAEGV